MGRVVQARRSRRGTYRALVVATSVIAVIAVALFALYSNSPPYSQGTPLVIDWRITIIINDVSTQTNYTLPAFIGAPEGRNINLWVNHTLDSQGPPGYSPLSTRDTSSTIYIQSTSGDCLTSRLCFTFADFFNVWGRRFDRTCVPDGRGGEYCADANNAPPVMYEGVNDPRCVNPGLFLSNGKTWIIAIRSTYAYTLPGGCVT